ncbi:kinase-like domain-containing protein [Fusarium flagelliforme]|uniref:non-specific serine/threonine protein kinase n=1 Tax=Fusarium flagelliforme TaxID=2675880 RepID=A0A395N0U1_9HYPO|nr:kinase-like domain-containing protein [Fusarium flagelliforme]KAH7179804.1 kinase-like domain-containing protein [Fusarium flagelliforme]RFN53772.1 iks protein kinase [Fusarium flagelliforme]
MSLIPYQPHEGREIVLRHHNAIVVRDSQSHRLEIRGISTCPTCHQPLTRSENDPDRGYDRSFGARQETYVDPDYFRMLRAVNNNDTSTDHGPPSPVRRIFGPSLGVGSSPSARQRTPSPAPEEAEFVSSTPGVAQGEGSRIRRDAFSPNYFNTFFVEERVLGQGGKGVVLLVRHEIDGCALGQFACKRVPVGDDHAWLEKVLIEVELLAKLSHPNLVSYRHVWLEDFRLTRFGPSVACAFILQQYCNGGDLHQYIIGGAPREATKEELKAQMRRRSKGQLETPVDLLNGNRVLSVEEIYSLFKDITSGVAYLHAANYIHRDLKPSNCLMHREGGRTICLISDFGEVQPENVVRKSSGTTGTISYCAPEVLKMDAMSGRYANFTTKSDIFSLGMILYFMCFGRLPYQNANALQEELEDVDELRAEITQWEGFQDERRERPDLPPRLYQLLKRLLALDPADRPSANEVLKAMRGESVSFDNGASQEPAPNLGIGTRIQNLDSPAPPSTPVPGPRHRNQTSGQGKFEELGALARSTSRDLSPSKSAQGSRLDPHRQSLSRHRGSHSMVVSRSQESRRSSLVTPAVSVSDASEAEMHERRNSQSPPLLMPPPSTTADALRRRVTVFIIRLMNFAGPHSPLLGYIFRLGLFGIKVTTLLRPCWPLMAQLNVVIPLIGVAALDLGLPQVTSYSPMLIQGHGDYFSNGPRAWGLGMSLTLLVLHFTVLWVASGWETLCVDRQHDIWTEGPW